MKVFRKLLLLWTFFCGQYAIGQQQITNELTENHQLVPGTKTYMIPPKGFTNGVGFLGFQETALEASILFLHFPNSFKKQTIGFTEEHLTGGTNKVMIKVHYIDTLKINAMDALLIYGEQEAYGRVYTKYILALGDAEETVVINGAFYKEDTSLDSLVKNALLSCYFDKTVDKNKKDVVAFTLDDSETEIKFAQTFSNSMIYTTSKRGMLMATTSMLEIAPSSTSNRKLYCQRKVGEILKEGYQTISIKEVELDALQGYEVVSHGIEKTKDKPFTIFQTILFLGEDDYFIFTGMCHADEEYHVAQFRKLIATFKRKS